MCEIPMKDRFRDGGDIDLNGEIGMNEKVLTSFVEIIETSKCMMEM